MKREDLLYWPLWPLLLVILCQGCGYEVPPELQAAMDRMALTEATLERSKVESWAYKTYGTPKGWTDGTPVYEGSEKDISTYCHAEVCSCFSFSRIVFTTERGCRGDWGVTHEFLHLLSVQMYEDLDPRHARFPGPYYQATVAEILGG